MSNQDQLKNVHVHIEKAKYRENKLWPWHEQIQNENWQPVGELQWSYILRQTQVLGTMIEKACYFSQSSVFGFISDHHVKFCL